MRTALALAVALGVVACGGSSGSPLDDDSGGGDGGTQNDATVGSDSSTGSDAATGSDSPSTSDASCPSFCASLKGPSIFCSDFDSESSPNDWTNTIVSQGGAVTIVQNEEVSCPNGLEAMLPLIANVASTPADAKVTKDVAAVTNATHAEIDLEAYLPTNDTKSYIVFFGVHPSAEPKGGIFVTHHADAFWFLTNSDGVNIAIDPAPLTGAWNAMTLSVTFAAQSGAVSFTYTGADNVQHTITGNGMTAAAPAQSVTAEVGMEAPEGTEAIFATYYDNVVLKGGQ